MIYLKNNWSKTGNTKIPNTNSYLKCNGNLKFTETITQKIKTKLSIEKIKLDKKLYII